VVKSPDGVPGGRAEGVWPCGPGRRNKGKRIGKGRGGMLGLAERDEGNQGF